MTPEALFLRYRQTGDAEALGAVFDRLAAELVLVAGHLAGSEVAEDLVQATFLDAIRHRERWDASRRLAPWLIGLLGNHVRQARRLRQRLPAVDRLSVRESVAPSAAAEANEALAEVHAAVARLPRHYRQVLSLRLVHGLQVQQIATSLDVPLGTVKVRLHRGFELLRRALPTGLASTVALLTASDRGLAAIRDAVLARADVTGTATATAAVGASALLGGWIMKNVAVGFAACVLLMASWFTFDLWQSSSVPTPTRDARVEAGGVGAMDVGAAMLPDGRAVVRREASPASPSSANLATGVLAVQVVWQSDRTPAERVAITVQAESATHPVAVGRSDATGGITFADLLAGRYRVLSTPFSGSYDVEVVAGETTTCEAEVHDEYRLRVVVVDDDSVPQSGAAVWGSEFIGDETPQLFGQTDAAGILRYRGPALGAIWARLRTRQPSARHVLQPPDIGGGVSEEVTATLTIGDPGCTLQGNVLDPSGRPLAGARVAIAVVDAWHSNSDPCELVMTTGAEGRFSCDELPHGERYVVAHHEGFAPVVQRATTDAQPTFVTLPLAVGARLEGRVTDAAGAPVAGVRVQAFSSVGIVGVRGPWGNRPQTVTDADGRYNLRGILAGTARAIVSLSPHVAKSVTLQDGAAQVWDVQQAPELSLQGLITDPDDKPLVRWRVEVMGGSGFLDHAVHQTETDAAGRFRVGGLRDRDYQVRAFSPNTAGSGASMFGFGIPRATRGPVRPSAELLTIGIERAAMSDGWIEGSVVPPEGPPQSMTVSLVAKVGGSTRAQLDPGQTSFRFGPLPAGEYDAVCEIAGRGRIESPTVVLHAGETLRLQPFLAGLQRPAELVLKHPDGRPCEGASVVLMPGMIVCKEEAPGHYRSRPVSQATFAATVHGPGFTPMRFSFLASPETPAERTVTPSATVQLVLQPALARKQWRNVALVLVKDSSGAELINGVLQIDGTQDFVWSLGLSPGVYDVQVRCSDGNGTATVTVNDSSLRVELPLLQ